VLLLAILGGLGHHRLVAQRRGHAADAGAAGGGAEIPRGHEGAHGRSDSALETVQKAAAQIEQAAQESAPGGTRGAMRVVVEPARFNIRTTCGPAP
jgi:hypothetical protein